jgi:hypothetical protein
LVQKQISLSRYRRTSSKPLIVDKLANSHATLETPIYDCGFAGTLSLGDSGIDKGDEHVYDEKILLKRGTPALNDFSEVDVTHASLLSGRAADLLFQLATHVSGNAVKEQVNNKTNKISLPAVREED